MTDQTTDRPAVLPTFKKGPDGRLVRTLHGLAMQKADEERAAAAQKAYEEAPVNEAVVTTYGPSDAQRKAANAAAAVRTASFQARVDARHAEAERLAAELRRVREAAGLTREEMAVMAGVTGNQIKESELNRGGYSNDSMAALLEAYKVVAKMAPKRAATKPTER